MRKKSILLPQEGCLVIQPSLIKEIGRSASCFLQQLHYWINNPGSEGVRKENKKWVYNTLEEWASQIVLSPRQVHRIVSKLRNSGIILVRTLSPNKQVRTNYYTINYDALNQFKSKKLSQKNKDILSDSECQNVNMYSNETNITNINTNKSKPMAEDENSAVSFSKSISENALTEITATELLKIWNDTVGEKTHSAGITKDRARFLKKAFHDKFESSIENWRKFCEALTQSDFLMGKVSESFKLQLDWVLKFSTLQKIFEGAYGVKYSQGSQESKTSEETLSVEEYNKEIDARAETEFDQTCQKKLLSAMLQAGEGSRYHFSFHKVRHNFKLGEVATREGIKPHLICEIDGYLPVYEETYTDMFTRLFSEIIGVDKKLSKEQILFKKEGVLGPL